MSARSASGVRYERAGPGEHRGRYGAGARGRTGVGGQQGHRRWEFLRGACRPEQTGQCRHWQHRSGFGASIKAINTVGATGQPERCRQQVADGQCPGRSAEVAHAGQQHERHDRDQRYLNQERDCDSSPA
jgi:hypothetical protein